jgi:hypothetical protein
MQTDILGAPESNIYASQRPAQPAGKADRASAKAKTKDSESTVLDEVREKYFQAYVASSMSERWNSFERNPWSNGT